MSNPTASSARSVIARGRAGLAVELLDARDRFIASDPGLFRLRRGLGAVIAVSTTALLEVRVLGALGLTGGALILPVLLGAVMAMVGATSVRELTRGDIGRAGLWLPPAAAVGFTAGTLAHPSAPLALSVFVGTTFVAVWVRRFGPRWFARGFLLWEGYFFTLFIGPPPSMLPYLLLSVVISSAWVTVLLTTVLFDAPASRMRRTVTALRARLRAAISACLELIDHPGDAEVARRLRAQLVKASAVTLLIDAQSSAVGVLPAGLSPNRVRRWVMDLEIGLQDVVGATLHLTRSARTPNAGSVPEIDRDTFHALRTALKVLGWGDLDMARRTLSRLPDDNPTVRRLTSGGRQLIEAIDAWQTGGLANGQWAPGDDTSDDDYEPVVSLLGDNLPGTAALAGAAVSTDTSHWWSPGRLAFTTRQAVQGAAAAALATGAGELLSHQRYYWAAIAAFVTFAGTSTATETVRKALARTVGTLFGLVVALLLAQASQGDPALTITVGLVCIFGAFYLQPLSYAAMTFFITIVLGELYVMMRLFSDAIMVLRLEETAVGAAAGIIATFLVLPVPAVATARVARTRLLEQVAVLLDACADRLGGLESDIDPLTAMIQVSDAARQVSSTRSSPLRPLSIGTPGPRQQHYTTMLVGSAAAARAVGQWLLAHPHMVLPAPAEGCRVLADECRRLASLDSLLHPPRDSTPVAGPDDQVQLLLGADDPGPPAVLGGRLRRLADTLALLTPRGRLE